MSNFEYKVKRENPNDEFILISDWAIESGDKIAEGDYICCLESSKSSYDVEAEREGYIHFRANEGERLDIGATLFFITDSDTHNWETEKRENISGEIKITRKAQKLIEKFSLQVNAISPVNNKIGEDEVKTYINSNNIEKDQVENKNLASEQATGITTTNIKHKDEELSPAKAFEVHFMNQNRDVIYSKVTKEISANVLESIITKNAGSTIGEIISVCTIPAIKKFSYINSCYTNNKIRVYEEYNLGLAINIGKGLKVPVFKNFNNYTLEKTSVAFKEMAMSYMRDELKGSDLAEGTFTVTDLSSLAVKDFLPVVSKDQGAILGICAISKATNSLNLVLGFDHRIIDGMYAAQFLNEIEKTLKHL